MAKSLGTAQANRGDLPLEIDHPGGLGAPSERDQEVLDLEAHVLAAQYPHLQTAMYLEDILRGDDQEVEGISIDVRGLKKEKVLGGVSAPDLP